MNDCPDEQSRRLHRDRGPRATSWAGSRRDRPCRPDDHRSQWWHSCSQSPLRPFRDSSVYL